MASSSSRGTRAGDNFKVLKRDHPRLHGELPQRRRAIAGVADASEIRVDHCCGVASASRSASPIRYKASTVNTTVSPGAIVAVAFTMM